MHRNSPCPVQTMLLLLSRMSFHVLVSSFQSVSDESSDDFCELFQKYAEKLNIVNLVLLFLKSLYLIQRISDLANMCVCVKYSKYGSTKVSKLGFDILTRRSLFSTNFGTLHNWVGHDGRHRVMWKCVAWEL
jgi:hypothetical protein